MATEHPTYSLNISLDPLDFEDGKISLRVLRETLNDLQSVLSEIEKSISGEDVQVDWEWDGDPEIGVIASVNGISGQTLGTIINQAKDGFIAASREVERKRGSASTSSAERRVKNIVNRLSRIANFTVNTTDNDPIQFEKDADRDPVRRRKMFDDYSEVDGRLEVIDVHRRPRFVIYEHGTGHAVRCHLPEHLKNIIKEALENRVIVEGLVRYREDGIPISVSEITKVEVIPMPIYEIDKLQGAVPKIGGDIPSGEFMRRIREENDD